MNTSIKLRFNLIGQFLSGYDTVLLEDEMITIVSQGKVVKSYSIKDFIGFATFKKKILGCTLRLPNNDQTTEIKWLKNKDSLLFLDKINNYLAAYTNSNLVTTIAQFQKEVIDEYPRDSNLGQISKIIKDLFNYYNSQKELWDTHLEEETLRIVLEIIQFHPVTSKKLCEYHESIQLDIRKKFLDTIESNPLTEEQRLAVIRNNDRNMVLAAAGTGKTSVIVAKALDLVGRKLTLPENILILAYNKAAAKELNERLIQAAEKNKIILTTKPKISTFHSLGRQILLESKNTTNISIFTEDDVKLKQWITQWLEEYLSSGKAKLLSFINLFPEPVNPFDFKTKREYENYIRDNEFRTLNGEKVKGYQELKIANFLFVNGIPYTYEAKYISKRRIETGIDYRPDFFINDTNIYIEHFGIDREGNTRADIDSKTYNADIQRKQKLHREYETKLIETYHYEWCEDNLLSNLKLNLLEHKVSFKPLSQESILSKLQQEGCIAEWSNWLKKALLVIRTELLTKDDIFNKLKVANISEPLLFSTLLDSLHFNYIKELQNQKSIDFDDMITQSISCIKKGSFSPKWDYILVDEYQDISTARMNFIRAIIDKGPKPSFTVVGDDWQAIYRFNGGKLELTTKFGEEVGPYTETTLQKTFRYNNSIAHTAGKFIMANPLQYKKFIRTNTKVDEAQVFLLDDIVGESDGVNQRLCEVLKKIRENDTQGSIAVMARYNLLIKEGKEALTKEGLTNNVSFWTFHKSKGLEADYSILIGFSQGFLGFPSENKNNIVIEALLPSLEEYPHAEERRLLYVAITRAKKKCYIIADPTSPSTFITELLAPKYQINISSKKFQKTYQNIFKCPNCIEGYLKLINGPHSDFYSCSSSSGCSVGKARVCIQCGSPSIDYKGNSICNYVDCKTSIKICEKCGRVMKKRVGKYSVFWGCSGYGLKQDPCKHTVKT